MQKLYSFQQNDDSALDTTILNISFGAKYKLAFIP